MANKQVQNRIELEKQQAILKKQREAMKELVKAEEKGLDVAKKKLDLMSSINETLQKEKKINECLIASSGNDINIINEKIKGKVTIRNSGSAALDMAYVACGRYDAYFQKKVNLWDVAAGIVIIKEAGGYIDNIDLNKHNNVDVVASNSSIDDKLRKSLINF